MIVSISKKGLPPPQTKSSLHHNKVLYPSLENITLSPKSSSLQPSLVFTQANTCLNHNKSLHLPKQTIVPIPTKTSLYRNSRVSTLKKDIFSKKKKKLISIPINPCFYSKYRLYP